MNDDVKLIGGCIGAILIGLITLVVMIDRQQAHMRKQLCIRGHIEMCEVDKNE